MPSTLSSGTRLPHYPPLDILIVIFCDEQRQIISLFYGMLNTPSTTKLTYSVKQKWSDGIGVIEDEDWGDILETPKLVSP